jgi:hypothetical protein
MEEAIKSAQRAISKLEKKKADSLTVFAPPPTELSSMSLGRVMRDTFTQNAAVPPQPSNEASSSSQQSGKKRARWGELAPVEVTQELKKDLLALQLRSYVDPKKLGMKRDDLAKRLPDAFQVGVVVDDPYDPFHRLPKRARTETFVSQYLDNSDVKQFAQRKFSEIAADRARTKKKDLKRHALRNKTAARKASMKIHK